LEIVEGNRNVVDSVSKMEILILSFDWNGDFFIR